ncbi:hypothetical protein IWQ56_007231, partial [Coemansia nantahalensis]
GHVHHPHPHRRRLQGARPHRVGPDHLHAVLDLRQHHLWPRRGHLWPAPGAHVFAARLYRGRGRLGIGSEHGCLHRGPRVLGHRVRLHAQHIHHHHLGHCAARAPRHISWPPPDLLWRLQCGRSARRRPVCRPHQLADRFCRRHGHGCRYGRLLGAGAAPAPRGHRADLERGPALHGLCGHICHCRQHRADYRRPEHWRHDSPVVVARHRWLPGRRMCLARRVCVCGAATRHSPAGAHVALHRPQPGHCVPGDLLLRDGHVLHHLLHARLLLRGVWRHNHAGRPACATVRRGTELLVVCERLLYDHPRDVPQAPAGRPGNHGRRRPADGAAWRP